MKIRFSDFTFVDHQVAENPLRVFNAFLGFLSKRFGQAVPTEEQEVREVRLDNGCHLLLFENAVALCDDRLNTIDAWPFSSLMGDARAAALAARQIVDSINYGLVAR